MVEQAWAHDLVVIYHSCGSKRVVIPDLIELGVDVIHPVQPRAAGMEIRGLARDFGALVSFCGAVDVRRLLVGGMAVEVRETMLRLRELFPAGPVVSPSHEAVLPDVPPADNEAVFRALHE